MGTRNVVIIINSLSLVLKQKKGTLQNNLQHIDFNGIFEKLSNSESAIKFKMQSSQMQMDKNRSKTEKKQKQK